MKKHIFELAFYFLLVISIGVFLFFIFKPFIGSIFLAVVFASVLYPAYRYITKLLQNRSTFSAIVTVVLFVLLIFIPLAIMLSLLLEEVLGMYSSIASGDVSLQGYLHSINAIGSSVIPAFDIKIADVYNSIQSIF